MPGHLLQGLTPLPIVLSSLQDFIPTTPNPSFPKEGTTIHHTIMMHTNQTRPSNEAGHIVPSFGKEGFGVVAKELRLQSERLTKKFAREGLFSAQKIFSSQNGAKF